ncbi:MAG: hypothetical protein BWX86_01671 [Verrucomicrobia bacterium ADurb.Bin122]|nr:MAG: hypothetical protein BWX86_01671 [Verrucomicrobia bacterium ADurb.Bin122]
MVHLGLEEAVDLLNAAFVQALLLHDPVKDRDVERDDRDRRAGLGDEGLVDRDESAAVAVGLEHRVDAAAGALEVVFGHADGAVLVNRPGDVGPDVGVGDGGGAGGDEVGVFEGLHPHLPIFTAHDGDGVVDLGLRGRVDGDEADLTLVGIDGLVGVGLSDGLEHGLVYGAGLGMRAARRGERIDHEVDRAHVAADDFEGLALQVVGKGVAVEIGGVEAGCAGGVGKCNRVVPAGGGGAVFFGGTFEKDAEGLGPGTEGGRDARGQAVTGGRANHEDVLGTALDGALTLHVIDLLLDVGGAAGGVRSHTDKATNSGFDDHKGADQWHAAGSPDKYQFSPWNCPKNPVAGTDFAGMDWFCQLRLASIAGFLSVVGCYAAHVTPAR